MYYHVDDEAKKVCPECKHCVKFEGGFQCALFQKADDSEMPSTCTARNAGMGMCGPEGGMFERKTNS